MGIPEKSKESNSTQPTADALLLLWQEFNRTDSWQEATLITFMRWVQQRKDMSLESEISRLPKTQKPPKT